MIGNKIQCSFKHTYVDDNNKYKEILMWCARIVTKVRDGYNILNDKGKNYGKVKSTEVQWHVDDHKGEEISFYIVQIRKSGYDCYARFR